MAKITITLDTGSIKKLDRTVGRKVFPNRSNAIQEAVKQKLSGWTRTVWPVSVQNLMPRLKSPSLKRESFWSIQNCLKKARSVPHSDIEIDLYALDYKA